MQTVKAGKAIFCAAVAVWALTAMSFGASAFSAQSKDAAKVKNPVKATPESIEAGKATYNKYCKFCHADDATGNGKLAPKDTHPPNLVDAKWDHGSTDGEIFENIKEGIGPKFDMKPMKAKMKDEDIWNVINYLRSLGPKK